MTCGTVLGSTIDIAIADSINSATPIFGSSADLLDQHALPRTKVDHQRPVMRRNMTAVGGTGAVVAGSGVNLARGQEQVQRRARRQLRLMFAGGRAGTPNSGVPTDWAAN